MTAAEQLVRRFTDRFWKIDWPRLARPSVYYDPRALEPDGPDGVLHAKGMVADEVALAEGVVWPLVRYFGIHLALTMDCAMGKPPSRSD